MHSSAKRPPDAPPPSDQTKSEWWHETGYQQLSFVSLQNAKAPCFDTTDISATLGAIPLMGILMLEDYVSCWMVVLDFIG
jgi:hypothetical protein